MAELDLRAARVDIKADAGMLFTLVFFPVYESTGAEFDLTGYGAEFVAKEQVTDETAVLEFSTVTSDPEIEVAQLTDPDTAQQAWAVRVVIDDTDTASVPARLMYRVNLINTDSNRIAALAGSIEFSWLQA